MTVRSSNPTALLLCGALLLSSACQARSAPALHWPVEPPPALEPQAPRLWVALADRLGSPSQLAPLELRSASGSLTLQDRTGRRWVGPRFNLQWQRVPLAQPLLLQRLVAGPFASFESAERRARQWRRLGAQVSLVHADDWELWAPLGAPRPPGWSLRPVQLRLQQAVVPAVQAPGRGLITLQGPVQITAPAGLLWRGGVYGGPFRLQGDAQGSWSLVEQVPLERYLEGVVPHEIGAGAPAAALAAQAVLARTWALRNLHRYRADGYHLCASTQCQVYSDPRQASEPVRQAIQRTRQLVLSWQDQPIHAVYHASNGGVSAPLQEAWDADPLPYLQTGLDRRGQDLVGVPARAPGSLARLLAQSQPFLGVDHPLFRWSRWLEPQQIAAALRRRGITVGQVRRLAVLERGSSGRVLALAIEGSAGRTVLRLDAIRRTLRTLPSTLFELEAQANGSWRLQGGGFGHGAGLSQAGAIDLGRAGWSFQQILARYYPGTRLLNLQRLTPDPPGNDP